MQAFFTKLKFVPVLVGMLLILNPFSSCAQEADRSAFSKLPLTVAISFHAVSTPLRKLGNNFRNVGIRVGTEFSLNKSGNMLQSLQIGYYRNRYTGNGLYCNSEFIYRPTIIRDMQVDFRLGPGISRVAIPMQGWTQKDSQWISAGKNKKSLLQLSGGVGVNKKYFDSGSVRSSPFVQYEVGALLGYSPGLPVLPFSFFHAGSRIKSRS